ncbi:hypothetical protein KCP74_00085 [Salmonella enterica subsp. enterica]|nr:hypothetical protein KCP74_00085 [Salmonella enterica subsp. enterica]
MRCLRTPGTYSPAVPMRLNDFVYPHKSRVKPRLTLTEKAKTCDQVAQTISPKPSANKPTISYRRG